MYIGFIGQGWVGKNYANDFENRKYSVVRFSLEEPHIKNKEEIKKCDIVFIAVPTPTTKNGFNDSAIRESIKLVGIGKIAVIKSTILPGTTESIQKENPNIFVLHSPEFLTEKNAAHDAAHPERNIVGIPVENNVYQQKAQCVLDILPKAPYEKIMHSHNAEFVKYAGNCFLFTKVIFMNLLYDLVSKSEGNWDAVRDALIHDPRIGKSHTEPTHKTGRGAGGNCFIKDFEAFRKLYEEKMDDSLGNDILSALKDKNISLLKESGKDLDIIESVYS